MIEKLKDLTTEQINANTKNIDLQSTIDMLTIINEEDQETIRAVKEQLPNIAAAVEAITEKLRNGGRLFYVGAGTSGRLGVLDASECPPTFGTNPEMVQGLIAGGNEAMFRAIEGAEDDIALGRGCVKQYNITDKDVIVGITASGRTPFVMGALQEARDNHILTIGLSNNANASINQLSDISISPVVGPEVIIGSTRLKSGTSQKMVLNMLTTATMIKLGKVYGNLMVDLMPTNDKLVARAIRIISQATGKDEETAERYLNLADKNAKVAIVMLLVDCSKTEAEALLKQSGGFVSKALENK